MSIHDEQEQLLEIINAICDYMLQMVSAKGEQAARLRHQIGQLRSNGLEWLHEKIFGTKMLDCFVTARTLPITTDLVASVRVQIQDLAPTGMIAIIVVESAIIFCLTTESIFITQMTFRSADDVQAIMKRMKIAFDGARDQAADRMDSASYQQLTYLSGSLINHLNATALALPRLVYLTFGASLPSLRLANVIYQDASRSDELVDDNKTVHPLFMQREIRALSA